MNDFVLIDGISKYSLEMVNCFERPQAILLENYKKDLGSLFLIYNGLAMSYFDKNYIKNNGFYFRSVEIELQAKLRRKHIGSDMKNIIIDLLNKNKCVLVPGNLKGLYYSNHYKVNDWKHLFLISGYDEQKDLFIIYDNEHQYYEDDNIYYTKFYIRYSDICEVFNSYIWESESGCLFYFDLPENIDCIKLTLNFTKIFSSLSNKRLYTQDYILSLIENETDNEILIQYQKLLINSSKYKYVMINEFSEVIKKQNIEIKHLKKINEELYFLWSKKILNKIHRKLLCKKVEKFSDDEEIVEKEEKLLDEVISIANQVSTNQVNNFLFEKYKTRNNNDEIIQTNNEELIFNFNKNKTYNWWTVDMCPKIIVNDNVSDEDFCFVLSAQILKSVEISGYQFGIYAITEKNYAYAFGYDYTGCFVIDLVGAKNIVKHSKVIENKKIKIFLKRINSKVIFGCYNRNEKDDIGYVEILDEIKELGVYCKTWDQCNEFLLKCNIQENMI